MSDEPNTPADEEPETQPAPTTKKKPRRGFAGMTREQVRAIASAGGKAAHAAGTAHAFTTEEARAAGRKGGVAPHTHRGRNPVRKPEGT